MAITSQQAREARVVWYHQIAAEDTAEELETWLESVLEPTNYPTPPDGWINDDEGGMFSVGSGVAGDDDVPAGVGDYLVAPFGNAIAVVAETRFSLAFMTV